MNKNIPRSYTSCECRERRNFILCTLNIVFHSAYISHVNHARTLYYVGNTGMNFMCEWINITHFTVIKRSYVSSLVISNNNINSWFYRVSMCFPRICIYCISIHLRAEHVTFEHVELADARKWAFDKSVSCLLVRVTQCNEVAKENNHFW